MTLPQARLRRAVRRMELGEKKDFAVGVCETMEHAPDADANYDLAR
jgi:hypothetical protein